MQSRLAWDFWPNRRYTSSKTKYGRKTDSEQVLRRKGEKNFEKGVKRLETVGKEGIKVGHLYQTADRVRDKLVLVPKDYTGFKQIRQDLPNVKDNMASDNVKRLVDLPA